ncbi:fibronectin type III domain-containing protein [Paenibacillus sp. Soil724D2]|uniref:fibronectin type III domain-containing protein n=1 Tax=Paenibacillus sp. (strain Soil724D2) TaxID=1736392 RepID=UPI00071517C6|nr:fibronectin type III domain-containing protein [Paenibacillus sp. Soil724D2]KRE36390.1 hypothetical protein ASG85_09445 [Paenibacillus sp. Soil724D2]
MKKLAKSALVLAMIASSMFASPFHNTVQAADYTATIDIDTSTVTSYNPDFRGVNNEPERTAIKFNDPELINAAIDYGRIGFVRWPGGTPTNAFSWKLGLTDTEFTGQTQKEDRRYYNQIYSKRYQIAKGNERISDYVDFLQQTGAKAVIMVNVLQYNPEQARDLAKYLYENHVPVVYFELGNEISFYVQGVGNQQPAFKSGTDYLDRVKTFNDVIKSEYPGAKTVVSMSNLQVAAFDDDLINYPTPYWDAITTHRFRGDGATSTVAMKDANTYLDDWVSFINSTYSANFTNPNIFIGEHGVKLGGLLDSTQYHGIYVSESILRLVTHPDISYLAGYRMANGFFTPGTDFGTKLEDAYQDGNTVDIPSLSFNSFYAAPSASLKVLDGAVNQGTTAWGTTVTGGTTVDKTTGTMSALFAQAFKGDNGKNYVVITNKSASTHDVTIKVNGSNVTAAMTKTYTTSTDPLAVNTDVAPSTIAVQSGSTGNPVLVPAYSVMRVEWNGTGTPDIPRNTNLIYADISSTAVNLKWQSSLNATGYKVKYGTTSGSHPTTIDVGNALTKNVTGLTNGSTYYFVITAYNSAGESGVSNEVGAQLAAPTAPLARRAYAETSGNIGVEWQSVNGATGYKVKYGTVSGTYPNVIDVGNNLGQLVMGLTPGTTYYFVVTAYNGAGESSASSELTAVAAGSLPLAPHDAQIGSETSTAITINWEPTRTETYHKYFEDGTSTGWTPNIGIWSVVNDLTRGVSFYQSSLANTSLTTFSASATGDYEGEAMIEQAATATGKTAYAYGLAARIVDNTNYYKFIYNINEDKFKIVKVVNGTETVLVSKTRAQVLTDTNATELDLTRLHMYFRVEGSTLTGSVKQLGPILSATDSTHSSGKLGLYSLNVQAKYDWVRLYRNNTDSYTVYRSTQPHTNFTAIQSGITGTSYTDSGLTAGTVYYYRIRAVNTNGESYHYSNTLRKN